MIDWTAKLTSRKFWMAVCGFVGGLIIAFGGSQQNATQITALIMSGASVIAYIVGEGMADAAGASSAPVLIDKIEDYSDEDDGK
jgi:hypothetical protein